MKVKVTLDKNGMGQLFLDGKNFSNSARGITLESKIGQIPLVTVTFISTEIEIELEAAEVTAEKALLP